MAPIKYPLATACAGCSSFHRYSLNPATVDRKSTRLNSSHSQISYAVFCLKKKKKSTIVYSHNLTPIILSDEHDSPEFIPPVNPSRLVDHPITHFAIDDQHHIKHCAHPTP